VNIKMKVYPVSYMEYGGEYKIDKIFSSELKARAYIKKCKKEDPEGIYDIDEFEIE